MGHEKESSSHSQTSSEPLGPLGTLFSFLSGFFFLWIFSRRHAPDREAMNTPHAQDSTDKEREGRQHISQSPTRVIIESFPPAPAPPKHWEAEKKKDRRPQWWTFAVNILTFLAVVWYAWVATQQRNAMLQQNKTADKTYRLLLKQMEGVSAAIVELKQAVPLVSVNGPPADGEVRFSFANTGHVIAHNVHVEFSATLHNAENPSAEKPLVAGNENIPQLPPSTANAYVPDLIFSFATSASSAKRITETYDDFVVVRGKFSYENGFDTIVDRPFCYGYIWGPSQFGRATPRCDDIPAKLKLLREAKKR